MFACSLCCSLIRNFLDDFQSLAGVGGLPSLASSPGRTPHPCPLLGGNVCLLEATVFSGSVAYVHSRCCEGRGGEGLSSHCIHGTHILGRISLPVSK